MKVIIVGTSHGGFEAVKTVLETYPEAEIKLFEQGATVSFLSCGIELYLEGVVKDINQLHYATKESYEGKGVDVYVRHDVNGLDTKNKTVHVTDLDSGKSFFETYDKLILTPGAKPVDLPIKGNDLENLFFLRGRDWAAKTKAKIDDKEVKNVVVIGSGYIGIEVVEAFTKAGKSVTVIDVFDRVLNTYLDKEFTDILQTELEKNGVTVKTNETVTELVGQAGKVVKVVTDKGEYPADLVVEAAGVRPNTAWLKEALKLSPKGDILVDEYQQTSAPDVFAAGDACVVKYSPNDAHQYIALATNARRQGVVAAKNLLKAAVKFQAVSGTSGLRLFDYYFATSGVKDVSAKNSGIKTDSVFISELYRPAFMEENEKVYLKLNYEVGSNRIVGGQLLSKHDITPAINTISLAILKKVTIQELAFADFFFQPEFDQQWNYLNSVAKAAVKQVEESK